MNTNKTEVDEFRRVYTNRINLSDHIVQFAVEHDISTNELRYFKGSAKQI